MFKTLFALTYLILTALPALAQQERFIEIAKQGWNYQLRTTMVGRDLAIPVTINGKTQAGVALCIVGEQPHAQSVEVLNAFRTLLHHIHKTPVPMVYAGPDADSCGPDRAVMLRLFSGHPPHQSLSRDIAWLNERYALGLPQGRFYQVSSPAMGQTFFGRAGQATHLMVKQPAHQSTSALEHAFYRSILIEELYQSFTFGVDLLQFDRTAPFISKLQETPMNLQRLAWGSKPFMRALVNSNPGALCLFDLFMLHAIAQSPVLETVDPAFITYIEDNFADLLLMARKTMDDPTYAVLVDKACVASTF